MNIGWQEFLGFYTGLNVVRKQYDEKFTEQKGIGEEIEDPNNSDEEGGVLSSAGNNNNPRGFTMAYRQMNEGKIGGGRQLGEAQEPLLAQIKKAGGHTQIQEEDRSEAGESRNLEEHKE